ncbi:MAG TPA: hypothetical protein ENF33_05400, partial [Nitrososphaeria archaeon]|nr:hypothetical protein [Nitrososphaeria archaeon]
MRSLYNRMQSPSIGVIALPTPIGMVSSGASESRATVILYNGMEKKVKNESLVIIRNKNGGDVLAVCRGGRGLNENVKTGSFNPGVAYARRGRIPSSAKEYYIFNLEVIGAVGEDGIEQNKLIIAPTSIVELFSDEDDPMKLLSKGSDLTIGHYWGKPN